MNLLALRLGRLRFTENCQQAGALFRELFRTLWDHPPVIDLDFQGVIIHSLKLPEVSFDCKLKRLHGDPFGQCEIAPPSAPMSERQGSCRTKARLLAAHTSARPEISLTVQRWALRPCPFTAPAFLPTPSLPLSRRPARTVRNPFAVQSGQTPLPPLVSRPQLGAASFCFRLRHRCHCAFPTCGPQTTRPIRV